MEIKSEREGERDEWREWGRKKRVINRERERYSEGVKEIEREGEGMRMGGRRERRGGILREER